METQKLINNAKRTHDPNSIVQKQQATTQDFNKVHPSGQGGGPAKAEPRKLSFTGEVAAYVKEVKKKEGNRTELLKNLKNTLKETVQERVFQEVYSIDPLATPIKFLLSKDSNLMAVLLRNSSMGIFRRDPNSGFYYQEYQVKGLTKRLDSLTFNHDERKIIMGGQDGKIRILSRDQKTGRFFLDKTINADSDSVDGLCISSDDELLFSSSALGKHIKIWKRDPESEEYKLLQTLEDHFYLSDFIKISRDKKILLFGDFSYELQMWKRSAQVIKKILDQIEPSKRRRI